jgi:oxygen-independent coproporphyrinogen III oxidase
MNGFELELTDEVIRRLEKQGFKRDRNTYEQVYFYPPLMSFTDYINKDKLESGPWKNNNHESSLYVHVPFCTGHCSYCHYVSQKTFSSKIVCEYFDALKHEIKLLNRRECFSQRIGEVIHVGGGTPTLLDHDQILILSEIIKTVFSFSSKYEYTWESSPETIFPNKKAKLKLLLKEGINRLSIGIESFEDHILKVCSRRHDSKIAMQSFFDARSCGFENINFDLIYGLADQTLDDWKKTLDKTIELQPDCVTAYHLRMKKGTPMSLLNISKFPTEEICRNMQLETITKLTAAGYHQVLGNQFVKDYEKLYRYEVEKFKDNRDIIGLGVSSYSYIDGWAYYNYRSLQEYYSALNSNRLPIELERVLSRNQRAARMVVLGLRRVDKGVCKQDFKETFDFSIKDLYAPTIKKLVKLNLIRDEQTKIILTSLGALFSDEVCLEFYAEEEKQQLLRSNASKYGLYLPFPNSLKNQAIS